MSTPSETISTETSHEPRPAAKRGDPRRRVRRVGGDDLGPLAAHLLQTVREALGVLLVDRHDEAAGLRMPAGAHAGQPRVGIAQDAGDPVAAGVERRAQPARGLVGGQRDREVGVAPAALADPLHVAVVGVERDRAADAVEQRVGVAVGVVGARDALVVVAHPRDRRVVGAKRRAGEQQAEAGAGERVDGRPPPRRVLAEVVGLVGDQQRRHLGAAAPVRRRAGGDGLVGDGDAAAIGRLGPRGVGPVGLEVEPVAGGVGRPLAADVGGRRDDDDAADPPLGEHAMGDVEPERGLPGGRRGGREEAVGAMGEEGVGGGALPRAQRAAGRPGSDRHG